MSESGNNSSEENQEGSNNQPNLAIEYAPAPTRPPRQPNNLQDLLRFAVETGSGTVGSRPSPQPMSDSHRGFLLNALNSMMVNVTEELASIMKTLKENHNKNKAVCIEALDNLSDFVSSCMDYANDFLKMGGLPVLELLLTGPEEELRWQAAEAIADIVQNNPFAQAFLVESSLFLLLLKLIEKDNHTTVQVKCLYAVSCLVRDNDLVLKQFIKDDGFSVLLRCLQSKQEKLVIKSCFLIGCLCSENNTVRDILLSMGMVDQLCSLIDVEHTESEVNEHLCSALNSLIEQSPQAIEICQQEPLSLKQKLNYIREIHTGQEEYHKELEYVDLIMKKVFENSPQNDEYEDR